MRKFLLSCSIGVCGVLPDLPALPSNLQLFISTADLFFADGSRSRVARVVSENRAEGWQSTFSASSHGCEKDFDMNTKSMIARIVFRFTLIAVTSILCGSLTNADEAHLASYNDLLRRIEHLESYSAHSGPGAIADTGGCESCGCVQCCCSPTLYAGAEMPWLQVQSSGFAIPAAPLATPNFGQEPSWRIWAGYESCEGLGFRATYWDFEDSAGISPTLGFGLGIDVYTADLELTQRAQFCGFDLLASGGVRIGGLEQSIFAPGFSLVRDFDGAGLTFGVGFERQVGCSPFDIYGKFRGSILFGDTDINVSPPPPGVTVATLNNQTMPIWEMQLGLEYNRKTSYGNLFARAGVEAQVWDVPPVVIGLFDTHIGFFGPTFAIGVER